MIDHAMTSDAEIVRLTLAGNRGVFERLLERHTRMAYAVAYARLGNHEDAQDAVQEAWVQAFQTLNRLREPEKFRGWFAVIVRNISINAAKKRRREQSLEETRGNAMYDLRNKIEEADMQRVLWSQVAALSPDHRLALTLHCHAGLSTEEIANMLGESRETIKKRLQRARTALNDQMLQNMFKPAERDEDRLRKRVMGLLFLMPVEWKNDPIQIVFAQPVKTANVLLQLIKAKLWLSIAAGALLFSAAFSGWLFWYATPKTPIRPNAPAATRPVTQPAIQTGIGTEGANSKTPMAPPKIQQKGSGKGVK
jgi:RNA polymerase sigma factor (sigma-70 family)